MATGTGIRVEVARYVATLACFGNITISIRSETPCIARHGRRGIRRRLRGSGVDTRLCTPAIPREEPSDSLARLLSGAPPEGLARRAAFESVVPHSFYNTCRRRRVIDKRSYRRPRAMDDDAAYSDMGARSAHFRPRRRASRSYASSPANSASAAALSPCCCESMQTARSRRAGVPPSFGYPREWFEEVATASSRSLASCRTLTPDPMWRGH